MLQFIKNKNPNLIHTVTDNIQRGKNFTLTGLTKLAKVFLLGILKQNTGKKLLVITANEQSCLKYKHDLSVLFNLKSSIFNPQGISTYEQIQQNPYEYSSQVSIINNLSEQNIIFTTPKALLEKFRDKEFYTKNTLTLKIDEEINQQDLIKSLVNLGYKRVTMVNDIREFSVRGDIVDIFSLKKAPYRLEFWGDSITDIRLFDPKTQKSFEKVDQAKCLPIYKFILNQKNKTELISKLKKTCKSALQDYSEDQKELAQKLLDETTEKLEQLGYFEGIEYYQSMLNPDLKGLIEIIEQDYIVVCDEFQEILTKYEQNEVSLNTHYLENLKTNINLPLDTLNHVEKSGFTKGLHKHQVIRLDNFIDATSNTLIELDNALITSFASDTKKITEYINENIDRGMKVVIGTNYKQRVGEILDEAKIKYNEELNNDFSVFLTENLSLNGCLIKDLKLVVLSDKELFNKHSKDITAKTHNYNKERLEYIESINDIQEGDYVVHATHGVGIYKGLNKQELDGQLKDYLTIEYANNDRLHIPAEQINFLCRYRGSKSVSPRISRMGGGDWEARKNRVKKAVEEVATELLELYADRQTAKGIEFDADTNWQYEMEEAFEFTETPDQLTAINDTKSDMESAKPMDRLICADVGFGKTEVAIRGLFKAVMSNTQAAIVVPTTILAMQHFKTITERFKPYPIKIDILYGFKTAKQQKETVQKLKNGEVDVVVATHRLLQSDIDFKNLGLLVVDEEHKFGVRDKEKLKMLKKNIDILSMSATPIPRTLYMSLSGIKDMSTINTPPTNRLPIKTFVGEYNETVIKNAIQHELDRDGQVFFVHNRVETIDMFAQEIQKLVPFAKIKVGHAQMDKKMLEKIMLEFDEREFDVLICSTIIESGLDIENSNTILIDNSDRFGLAQLYQLRGRVGRCAKQAYCYCFYKPNKQLTEEAVKRLECIRDFTTLGSGYQIAMRDIEIRGVGNILGTKQHGHMIDVGFDAYCQLLEEAINEQKGETVKKQPPAIIDININAFIEDDWVGGKEQKMIEYKRLADVTTAESLENIVIQWKDRFSKIPKHVENLISLVRLRILATNVHISIVRETTDNIRIYTPYTELEYRVIAKRLSTNITKHITFTIAPKSCKDGNSILLLKTSRLTYKEIFNILNDLFYDIHKIINIK